MPEGQDGNLNQEVQEFLNNSRKEPPKDQPPSPPKKFDVHGMLGLMRGTKSPNEDPGFKPTYNISTPTDGLTIVSMGRTYDFGDKPQIFTDKEGVYVDWRTKFDHENHEFGPGTRVLISAEVRQTEEDQFFLHVDAEGRIADNFYLENLPPNVQQQLTEMAGMVPTFKVLIDEVIRKDYQISDIHNYNALLGSEVIVPPINPTTEEIAKLTPGKRVVIDGIAQPSPRTKEYGDETEEVLKGVGKLILKTADGQDIQFEGNYYNTKIQGGSLENLRNKKVRAGELVRLTAYVRENDQTGEKYLSAHDKEAYLLKPSTERSDEYNRLRAEVAGQVDRLTNQIHDRNFADARNLYSEALSQELTFKERNELAVLITNIPEAERPIGSFREYKYMKDTSDYYKVNIPAMTKTEFEEFVKKVVEGPSEEPGRYNPNRVFGWLSDADSTVGFRYEVISTTIDNFIKQLEDPMQKNEDIYPSIYLGNALNYLAGVKSKEAGQKIVEVLKRGMDGKYYIKPTGQDYYQLDALITGSIQSLRHYVWENPELAKTIGDTTQMKEWQEELAGTNYKYTAKDLGKIVEIIETAKASE